VALQFGSGEPVSRLRRSLDVKGKLNLGLDETVVPVLNVFDATEPPFRRTGVRWFVNVAIGPIAGELARLRIFHTLPIDQLIDGISAFAAAGAGAIGVLIGAGPSGAAGGTPVRTTEVMPLDSGGVISRPLPIQVIADTVPVSTISQLFWATAFDADAVVPAEFNFPIVLPAQPDQGDPITNAPTLTIECQKVLQVLSISVTGLYWDNLPLNAKT